MIVERWDDSYQTMVSDWISQYKWSPIDFDCLPKTGVVAINQHGQPCAVGFVYFLEDTRMAFIDYIIGNPELSALQRGRGVVRVINTLINDVRSRFGDKGLVYTLTGNKTIENALLKQGFKLGESKVQSLYLTIGNVNAGLVDNTGT